MNEVYKKPMDFAKLQNEVREWAFRNFGDAKDNLKVMHCLAGVQEEVGELSHALLKQQQGIRGTHDEHEAAGKDAVADIIIYLTDLCNRKGWSLQMVMDSTWGQVKERDWQKNKGNGVPNDSPV